MILTNCAACAAPLALDAPRCIRCHTRYCDSTCQHDHWRRGHKQICKKIHRGGNAEQYHANKKYKEAVAVAVEACADTFKLQRMHAQCLYKHADASLEDVTTAIATLEDLDQRMGRIYGNVNPQARWTREFLEEARETLARAK